jgi:hypothetical protein
VVMPAAASFFMAGASMARCSAARTCGRSSDSRLVRSASSVVRAVVEPAAAIDTAALLPMSIRPGYTVSPLPSYTRAMAGGVTEAPTCSMMPSRNTIVPFSIGAPAAVTMRVFAIA